MELVNFDPKKAFAVTQLYTDTLNINTDIWIYKEHTCKNFQNTVNSSCPWQMGLRELRKEACTFPSSLFLCLTILPEECFTCVILKASMGDSCCYCWPLIIETASPMSGDSPPCEVEPLLPSRAGTMLSQLSLASRTCNLSPNIPAPDQNLNLMPGRSSKGGESI